MGEYDEAIKTMGSLKAKGSSGSPFGDADELREIATLRLEAGDFAGARATIESIDDGERGFVARGKQDALAAVALAQAKAGAFDETLTWVEKLKSPRARLLCLAGYGQGIAELLSKK
jgi:hypothetical protein